MPLVITRRVDEGVWIGDDIHVTVIEVRGEQVRLSIAAPDEVKIMRDEIHEEG